MAIKMTHLNIGDDEFEVVDGVTRRIAEDGQFDTIPTGGVIYIDGDVPDGFEEVDAPPQFAGETFVEAVASAGNDNEIGTTVTVEEVE